MNILSFSTETDAIAHVCHRIQQCLISDIQQKGKAGLILTGGKSVQPFLGSLATLPIDWSKVWIVLSDERWIPVEDENSNERQLKALFLDKLAKKPNYLSLKTAHALPHAAIPQLKLSLEKMTAPHSASLLSMGEDGHVASLFSGEQWENGVTCCFKNQMHRISLSLDYFTQCQQNFILVKSERKTMLDNILSDERRLQALQHFEANAIVY